MGNLSKSLEEQSKLVENVDKIRNNWVAQANDNLKPDFAVAATAPVTTHAWKLRFRISGPVIRAQTSHSYWTVQGLHTSAIKVTQKANKSHTASQ